MKASPAAKVAAGATAVIAVVYIIGVIIFNVLFASHQTAQSDYYLATRLTSAAQDPAMVSHSGTAPGSSGASDDVDADSAPVFLWLVNAAGQVTGHSLGAPELPAGLLAAHPPCRLACLPRMRRTTGSPSPPTSAGRTRSGSS